MNQELTYRPFQHEDIHRFCKWKNQKEIWQVDEPGEYSPLEPAEIESWFNPIVEGGNSFIVSINGLPIGYTGFKVVDSNCRSAEFIIVIGEISHWSKGYGKKIMKWLFELAFNNRKYDLFYGYVLGSNERALSFYKTLGFEVQGNYGELYTRFGSEHRIKYITKTAT
jgi:RimJ/RimL family protein N-acetyltransferase